MTKNREYFYIGVGVLSVVLMTVEYFFDTPLDPAGKLIVEGFFNFLFNGRNFFSLIFFLLALVCFSVPVANTIQLLGDEKSPKSRWVLVVTRRWLVGCFVFAFLFLGFYEVSQEILVRIYMHGKIGLERADLSEDYGLGMLSAFSSLVYAVTAFPTLLYFVCKFFKNR